MNKFKIRKREGQWRLYLPVPPHMGGMVYFPCTSFADAIDELDVRIWLMEPSA